MQDGDFVKMRTRVLEYIEGGLDFRQRCHSSREDDLPAQRADAAQIGVIAISPDGILNSRCPRDSSKARLSRSNAVEKNRSRALRNAQPAPGGPEGKLQPAQHFSLTLLHAGIGHLIFRLTRRARRQAICAERLELDQIGTGLRRDINKASCAMAKSPL